MSVLNKVYFVLLFIAGILNFSCDRENIIIEDENKEDETIISHKVDTGYIKENGDTVGFYELIDNRKNGDYKYFLNNKINQECLFYNDTILGYINLYDSSGILEMKKSYNYYSNRMNLNEEITFLKNGNIDESKSYYIEINDFSPILFFSKEEKINLKVNINNFEYDSVILYTPFDTIREGKNNFVFNLNPQEITDNTLLVMKFNLISYLNNSKVISPVEKRLLLKLKNQ